ncbi:MAG: hypothetical protein AB1306_00780 [Nitrospirota bacterium]
MKTFRSIAKRFENAMVAATFAEAGEFETARQIVRDEEISVRKISRKTGSAYATKAAVNSAARSK